MAFQDIVFMQDDQDTSEAFSIYDVLGVQGLAEHLLQWDNGEGEITTTPPWGSRDRLHELDDGLILIVHPGRLYVGACRKVEAHD